MVTSYWADKHSFCVCTVYHISSCFHQTVTDGDQQYLEDVNQLLFDDENLNPVSPIEFGDDGDSFGEENKGMWIDIRYAWGIKLKT